MVVEKVRVVRGRGGRLPRAAARVHPGAAHGQRGGRRCGRRGASHTSNFEKASKKNETAFSRRFSSSSSCGLFGLSPPLPPTVEHHFPVGGGGGARQLHTIVAGGAACGERRLAGRCARACVHGTVCGADIDGVAVVVVGGGAAGLAIVAVAAAFGAVADLDRLNRGWRVACCYVAAAAGQRVIHEPRGLHALRFGSGTP